MLEKVSNNGTKSTAHKNYLVSRHLDGNRVLFLQNTQIKHSVSTFTRTVFPDRRGDAIWAALAILTPGKRIHGRREQQELSWF